MILEVNGRIYKVLHQSRLHLHVKPPMGLPPGEALDDLDALYALGYEMCAIMRQFGTSWATVVLRRRVVPS
jgi:hypothetical protein